MHGDSVATGETTSVPDHVAEMVYGRFGFNAEHTAILGYRAPYVLLVTPGRRAGAYSIVDTSTGRTAERFDDPSQANTRLAELAG